MTLLLGLAPAVRRPAARIATLAGRTTGAHIHVAGQAAIGALYAVAVVSHAVRYPFTSDDVAVQNILASVREGAPLQAVTGSDTFALKVPIYLLVDAMLPASTVAIALTVLLCSAPLLIGVGLLSARALGPAPSRTLAAAAVALQAGVLVSAVREGSSLAMPNGRNAEIGIALLVVVLADDAARAGARPRGRQVLAAAARVLALAAVFASDPLFLYLLVGTTALLAAIRLVRGGARNVGGVLPALETIVAAALAVGAVHAMQAAGALQTVRNYVVRSPEPKDLPGLAAEAIGRLLMDLGADIWGRGLSLRLVPGALGLVLALAVVALAASAVLRRPVPRWAGVLAVLVAVDVALVVLSSNAAVDPSGRFVLPAAFALLPLAVVGLRRLGITATGRRLVAVVGVVGALCAAGATAVHLHRIAAADGRAQERTAAIIAAASEAGAGVGWADYWDANVTSYLSDRHVVARPLVCDDAGLHEYAWFVNRPDLALRSPRSFVVLDATAGCTRERVEKAFGPPASATPIPGGVDAVLVYDHDLEPR